MVVRPIFVETFGQLVLCVLTAGIAWVVLRIRGARTQYRLTNQRFEIRTGLFSRHRRNIELYRVKDLEVKEPLFLRMRGSGYLILHTMDPKEPDVTLPAVENVREVSETLRRLVHDERRRTGVRLIEER